MLKYFPVFKSVYETGNFTKSSQQLFVAQSTVSQQIKQLETSLGVKLFERQGKREIKPTHAAVELYEQGLPLFEAEQQLADNLRNHNQAQIKCQIGVSNTIAESLIAKIFKQLQIPPNVSVTLQMANSTQIVKKIQSHEYQFGFIEKPLVTPGLDRQAFFQDQLVRAGDLKSDLWLLRENGSGVRHFTDQYLKQHNLTPKHPMTLANNELILQFLQVGMGQSIISKLVLPDHVPSVNLDTGFHRSFYFVAAIEYQAAELNILKQQIKTSLEKIF